MEKQRNKESDLLSEGNGFSNLNVSRQKSYFIFMRLTTLTLGELRDSGRARGDESSHPAP